MTNRTPRFAPYVSPLERLWFYTLRTLCVLLLVFLLLPILVIIPLSFSDSTFLIYPIPGFSWRWYENLFTAQEWTLAARNSFIVAPLATLLATVLGTLAAVGLNQADFRGKNLLMAILISPMIVPAIVVGVAMYLFFAPLRLSETYTGLILSHAALGAPFVVTTVLATLQGYDYNLTRAGASLGSGPLQTFMRITLPVIAPGVVAGALFAFATSFDEVVVTLFMAGTAQTTLPRQMFSGIRENINPTIAALATILVVFTTSLMLVMEWLRSRARRR
jgi:putative spermidine/putrescine transport system permease protein